jgi:hypothetical protein
MVLDSHVEKKLALVSTLGIPRWHKRASYYLFKIIYLQQVVKSLSRVPNGQVRSYLAEAYNNEYEVYSN